jgi:radical SAM protein with 4Fe4S-binding SPASM domain
MNTNACQDCPEHQHIPAGLLLQWHVTERCNLRCTHCYQESHGGAELEFPQLLGILAQYEELLARWRGTKNAPSPRGHITVTGGEPFVRRDFLELLEVFAARRQRFSFAILTNGTLIDSPLARRLRELGPRFIQVSIDGTQATHDRIRGSGSYERAVAALRHLKQEGVRTLISFTAQRGNFREFADVARLGQRLGVDRVWADRLIPVGVGADLQAQVLTPQETREFFAVMRKSRPTFWRSWFGASEVAMHRALQFLVGGGRPYRCTAGDSLITVQPNGDVVPCRRMPLRVGNLLETPLAELYERSPLLRALRDPDRPSRGCEECAFARLCGGGLRCLSTAVHGDPFVADPGCWLARNETWARPGDRQSKYFSVTFTRNFCYEG